MVWKACRGFVPALTVPAAATSRRTFPRGIAPSPLCHTDSAHVPHLSASRAVFDEENPSLEEALDRTAFVFESLTVEETQKRLVTEGVQYSETAANSSLLANQAPSMQTNSTLRISAFERVPGCVANVNIRSILCPVHDSYSVKLEGNADALLSRGLLAITSRVLYSQQADAILQMEPKNLADRLGIRPALSQGRNDGLASMLRTVQQQIRTLQCDKSVVKIEENPHRSGRPTVALLLSGGVDSSVALNLLVQQGYDVTAFYLKIWLEDELAHLGHCPWEDDYRVCQEVCEQAGIPLETVSLQNAYKSRVIAYTVHEAEQGRTPNPDIMCNSRVKFGCFYEAIDQREFDFVASGHYAQLVKDTETGSMRLLRAPDPIKDQSYFLCTLTQDQLQRVLFPIGHLQKSQVRDLADEFILPNRLRPDSQGLCFLGKVKFDEFLAVYLGTRPGPIVDAGTGDVVGQHHGVWYHTVGQRKGIGRVLDPLATSRGPWYVVAKDPGKDVVYCSNQYDEDIFTASRSEFAVENIHWIAGQAPPNLLKGDGGRFVMKIRHGPDLVKGTLRLTNTAGEGDVKLDSKDGGLAPGQYVVFYKDEECLGAGVISERHWARLLKEQDHSVVCAVPIGQSVS